MHMSSYEIYLINLGRSPERLAHMKDEFDRNNITAYERVEAVDGKMLVPDSFVIDNKFKREMTANEYACYLSHLKALQYFLQSDADFGIILEDDIKISGSFTDAVENAINRFHTLSSTDKWDMLKLWNRNRRNIPIADSDATHFIGLCGTSIPGGAIGYIWTRNGAEKFSEKVFLGNEIPVIKRPIDCEFQYAWEYNLLIYNLLPSVVSIYDTQSVIGETRAARHSTFKGVLRYEFSRLIPKYKYYIDHQGFIKFVNSFILRRNKLVL